MHYKLIVFGIVLIAAVVFGFLFWDDFSFNQQEIANTPITTEDMNQTVPAGSGANVGPDDSVDTIEADLDSTDVNNIDSDNSSLEAELNAM